MANKKGNKKLTYWLTDEEMNFIKQDAKKWNITIHEYIMRIIKWKDNDYEEYDQYNPDDYM